MNSRTRNVSLLILAALFLLAVGTTGYHLLEGWALDEAFYMTVITMSTVGFSEVHPLSATGRMLTVGLIFSGIGVIGIAATSLTAMLVSGEIRQLLRDRRMERKIQRMNGHTILCGYGRIGREIAREFLRGHHPLVVVDSSRASLADAREAGHMVIEGDATEEEVLLRANVAHAKGLVAALPRDSDNVYITLTAREYNRELHIAARSLDPGSEHRLLKAGANRVVNPYVIGGKRLAAVMLHPEIMDFLDLSMQQDPEGFSLRHLTVGSGSKLKDRTLAELDLRRIGRGVMVLGISRPTGAERSMVIPTADTALAQNDTLILLGNQSMYQALEAEGIVSR
ncbi:MAG: NAD-binding protein [Candidatus Delongbacteria bacterium]|nr:NAD-binding protein [Candidatus Delongbacteria bacterium]